MTCQLLVKDVPMRTFQFAIRYMLAIALLVGSTVATAAKPLTIFFVPGILQEFLPSFDNEFESLAALKEAIETAPQYLAQIGAGAQQYPYFKYDIILNPSDGISDLYESKVNEERYIDLLRTALQAGSYAAPSNARKLRSIFDVHLTGESVYLQGVIYNGFTTVCALLKAKKDVVLVAHSHGNIIANFIYAGAAQGCGAAALSHLRIVSVGSVSDLSPNNLLINQGSDAAVYTFLPNLPGLLKVRTTPYCNNSNCNFLTPPPTVNSSCSGVLPFSCHLFAGNYLSTTSSGTTTIGQRLSSSAYLVSGSSMRQRVADAFYTALDSLHGDSHQGDPSMMQVLSESYWARPDVTSSAPGQFELHSKGQYSSFVYGQRQYTQGGIVSVNGCMSPSQISGGALALQDVNFTGIFGRTGQANAQPLLGASVDWTNPGYLRLIDATGSVRRVQPIKENGRYCGNFTFGICPDGSSFAQFTNSVDSAVYRQWNAGPAVSVLRRFFALQYYNDAMTIDGLTETPYIFPGPYSTEPKIVPKACRLRRVLP